MTKPSKCARCGRENDPSLPLCVDCGASLRAARPDGPLATAALCARCGTPLSPGGRFCAQCGAAAGGAAMGESPARTDRHATVTPPPGAASPARAAPPLPPPLRDGRAAVRLSAVRHDGRRGAALDVRGETICGRTSDAPGALVLADDPTVSPRHARFRVDGGVLRVEDLGTENGTFVRLRAAPRRLGAGDEIRIGRQLLRVEPMPAGETAAAAGGTLAWGGPRGLARLRLVQLLDGGGAGEVFPLEPGEHIVGREAGHVAFRDDRYVSARHALLTVSGDEVTIADAGSSNGTFVRISAETELGEGDELLVGGQLLRVGG